jgi:hypothetical protein
MSGCIYLGLQDDPETVLQFASEGNFCHHALPAATPNPAHQKTFCLTNKHTSCPVFLLTELKPLPREVIFRDYKQNFTGKVVYRGILLAILLVFVSAALVGALGLKGVLSTSRAMPEGTIGATFTQFPLVAVADSLISPTSPILPVTPNAALNSTDPACTAPEGWILYTVLPADSIIRLSLFFGISVVELQSANCLEGDDVLQAGDQIYVPSNLTSTSTPDNPSPTPTATLLPEPTSSPGPTPTATLQPAPTSSPRPKPSYTFTPNTPTKEPKPKPPSPIPPATDTPVPAVPTSSPPPPSPMPQPTNTTAPQPATPTSPPPP